MSCGFRTDGPISAQAALESLVLALFITGTPFTKIELVKVNESYHSWEAS